MAAKLDLKELLFCYYYVKLQSPKEAAIRAGYSTFSAEKTGTKLLLDKNIQNHIEKLSGEAASPPVPETAMQGLARLAFTPANDAVMLALCAGELSSKQVAALDLYHVSECKKTKDGFEVKFFDRLKALEKLFELSERQSGESDAVEFYTVLEKSAKSLSKKDEELAD